VQAPIDRASGSIPGFEPLVRLLEVSAIKLLPRQQTAFMLSLGRIVSPNRDEHSEGWDGRS